MEDAYAIPKGEIGLEGGVRFNDRREGRTNVTFQPQIIYGAFANTQIEIQVTSLQIRSRWSVPTSRGSPPGPALQLQHGNIDPACHGCARGSRSADRCEFKGGGYAADRNSDPFLRAPPDASQRGLYGAWFAAKGKNGPVPIAPWRP